MGALRKKRPHLLENYYLHQDNAPAHTAHKTAELMKSLGMRTLPHPAYSPDLAPADFWLFPYLKAKVRGIHFDSVSAMKEKVQRVLYGIKKEAFQTAFESWIHRMRKCVSVGGDYIEKI